MTAVITRSDAAFTQRLLRRGYDELLTDGTLGMIDFGNPACSTPTSGLLSSGVITDLSPRGNGGTLTVTSGTITASYSGGGINIPAGEAGVRQARLAGAAFDLSARQDHPILWECVVKPVGTSGNGYNSAFIVGDTTVSGVADPKLAIALAKLGSLGTITLFVAGQLISVEPAVDGVVAVYGGLIETNVAQGRRRSTLYKNGARLGVVDQPYVPFAAATAPVMDLSGTRSGMTKWAGGLYRCWLEDLAEGPGVDPDIWMKRDYDLCMGRFS